MKIYISVSDISIKSINRELIRNAVKKTLRECGLRVTDPYEVSIVFINRDEIAEMNNEYRGINRATDVISFAFSEGEGADLTPFILGDIFICPEVVSDHSIKYGSGFDTELIFVIVHGVLHLLGFNHELKKERERMREVEDIIMKKLVKEWKGRLEK